MKRRPATPATEPPRPSRSRVAALLPAGTYLAAAYVAVVGVVALATTLATTLPAGAASPSHPAPTARSGSGNPAGPAGPGATTSTTSTTSTSTTSTTSTTTSGTKTDRTVVSTSRRPTRPILTVAPPPPHATAAQQDLARIAPSLGLVETTFTAQLSVPAPSLDQTALSDLESTLAQQVAGGQVGGDQPSIEQALVSAIDAAPLTYLKPTSSVQTTSVQAVKVGTGWVVSPGGYLVVPSNVVSPARDVITRAFDFEGLASLANQDARELAMGPRSSLSATELAVLGDAASKYNAHYVHVGHIVAQVTVQFGDGVVGLLAGRKGIVAHIVASEPSTPAAGTVSPGLALIHLDGMSNLATVPMGSLPSTRSAVPVDAVGYPYSSDFASYASPLTRVSPGATRTSAVTVTLPNSDGWNAAPGRRRKGHVDALALSAPLTPASTGTVVLGSGHAAIALVVSPDGGSYGSGLPGRSYALPDTAVASLMTRAHVAADPGTTTQLYGDAFDAWFAGRFKQALPLFEQIQSRSPHDMFAPVYVAMARKLVDEGRDRTPTSPWSLALFAIVVLLLVRLVAFPLIRFARRGHAHARRRALWATSGPVIPPIVDPTPRQRTPEPATGETATASTGAR